MGQGRGGGRGRGGGKGARSGESCSPGSRWAELGPSDSFTVFSRAVLHCYGAPFILSCFLFFFFSGFCGCKGPVAKQQ